jgi:hypothetical protein
VRTRTARLRRLAAIFTAVLGCVTVPALTAAPVAHAADGREMLAGAIGATQGTYLVYNFGPGHPTPLMDASGRWYEMNNGGHLMIIKNAAGRLSPRLLVDTHRGDQARCENNPGARTSEGLLQASELYTPLQAWQRMGEPSIAINANFFDVRPQKGGSWRTTGCSSPLGAFVDNTNGQGRANQAVTGTVAYPGKQGLSGGGESWSSLTTMILPSGGAPYVVWPRGKNDYDSATPVVTDLLNKNERFVAVSGIGLLGPGQTQQLHDGGPSAARTALAYVKQRDEMYIFEGGSYTPDNMQDLFRGLGSDNAILLDGGGSSAIVLRRDGGGMWAGAGSPKGSCDVRGVLCDSHERGLPSWLGFN